MANEMQALDVALRPILDAVSAGFWTRLDFWISIAVSLGGLYYSVRAFNEAKRAREAAIEAGKTVKIQTVTIELTEIAQKLDKLQPDISFTDARDLISETSRRLRRAVSPFRHDPEFKEAIESLLSALTAAKTALGAVRPANMASEAQAPEAVYFGIESDLAAINNAVADLTGLFESRGFKSGEDHASE